MSYYFDTPQTLEELAEYLPAPWDVDAHTDMHGVVFDSPVPIDSETTVDTDSLGEDIIEHFLGEDEERNKDLGVGLFLMSSDTDDQVSSIEIEMAWPVPNDIAEKLRDTTKMVVEACMTDSAEQIEKDLNEGIE